MTSLSARTLGSLDGRVAIPRYDRTKVTASVVHLGVGGFHRAHQAVYHDEVMHRGGSLGWGICGVGVLPGDVRMRDALTAQDGLYTVLVKAADGSVEARVVGSIVDYLFAPEDPERVIERLAAAETKLVTLTITEGGYLVDDATGEFDTQAPAVARDLAGDPARPETAFGLVVEALRRRRERGVAPFTVLSCDNLEHNGEIARTAFASFAAHRDAELGAWIRGSVPFPSSVVDRITPATTDADRATARELLGGGVEDRVPVVCEPFTQWVIEAGAAGDELPPYADVGVKLADDVLPHELMKLRLLNAGHQALAHLGRLAGHTYVHEAARDPAIGAFLDGYLDREAVPTITGVPQAELDAFRAAVPERFGNPAIGDTLERLATDASDRIPKFLLPVVRARLEAHGDVTHAATVVAAWAVCAGTLPLTDRRADALTERARHRADDPLAFLQDPAIFGDLANEPRFTKRYRAALESLDTRGVPATLASLANRP